MTSAAPPVNTKVANNNANNIDVEKKCAVPLPNGKHCNRSITCKSHSMSAKRAVAGRSQPYDTLLAVYMEERRRKKEEEEEEKQA